MTERTHIQRYYRQRFAELHTRKLRVNSHRRIRRDRAMRCMLINCQLRYMVASHREHVKFWESIAQ